MTEPRNIFPRVLHVLNKHLLTVIIVLLSGVSFANAEFVPQNFEARYVRQPPVIDGKLNDAAWSTAQVISDFFAYQSGGAPPAAKTTARIMWDERFLYVGFEMADADIRPASAIANETGRDSQVYLGDVIELFVRPDRKSPQYFEFEWSPNGRDVFDARFEHHRFGEPGTTWNTDIRWATTVDGTIDNFRDQDNGWTVEAAIPLDGIESVVADTEWTFTVARYDYFNLSSQTEQLMMSAIGDPDKPNAGFTSGFHSYELYDNLKFVRIPGPRAFELKDRRQWNGCDRSTPSREYGTTIAKSPTTSSALLRKASRHKTLKRLLRRTTHVLYRYTSTPRP